MASASKSKGKKPMTTEEKVIMQHGRAELESEIVLEFNEALQKTYPPYLENEQCYYLPLKGDLKKYGDYICCNILHICEVLRSKDPLLFKKTQPRLIAKAIKGNFPNSDMIQELKIRDVGFLTFKLNGAWMAERIRKNLKHGVDAWTPLSPADRVIVDFPTQDIDAEKHADGLLSGYIRDTLVRMFEYCGVEVSGRMCNRKSLCVVQEQFPEENGFIRSKKKSEDLFVMKEQASRKAQASNIHEDLAAMWFGEYEQKAEWMIYVTPVRQREYIMQCFIAAREFVDERTTLSYLGYKTYGDEQEKLTRLWNEFETCDHRAFFGEGLASGYGPEAFFECTIKYGYLKNPTYSGCTFDAKDLLNEQGNTFIHLLGIQRLIKNSLIRPYRPNRESNKALVDREREVGLHLLQFTTIIEESILGKLPYLLCEYLYDLSKNVACYLLETVELSEHGVLLCNAVQVVMEKSFDLLGITPESSKGRPSYYLKQQSVPIRNHYISLAVDSVWEPTSRLELFSMSIEVPFGTGSLFGSITVSDPYGLRSNNWCHVDRKGCGHVTYFDHDWHDAVKFRNSSILPFGDRVSGPSVPFSSSFKIDTRLWVTSEEKDKCYQLCYKGGKRKLLDDFWKGEDSIEENTFSINGEAGSLDIYYCLLRDAVDTRMSLNYYGHQRVSGYILAYYGGSKRVGFHEYKALIFDTTRTKLKQGDLRLTKSMLAVPRDGSVVFDASFTHADTNETIAKKCEYRVGENSEWIIEGNNFRFILRVDWI